MPDSSSEVVDRWPSSTKVIESAEVGEVMVGQVEMGEWHAQWSVGVIPERCVIEDVRM